MLSNFEYDLDIRLNPANYDTQLERGEFFSVCLGERFFQFLKRQFALHSYDKYFLSAADLAKIFEPVHGELTSDRPRRVPRPVPRALRAELPDLPGGVAALLGVG